MSVIRQARVSTALSVSEGYSGVPHVSTPGDLADGGYADVVVGVALQALNQTSVLGAEAGQSLRRARHPRGGEIGRDVLLPPLHPKPRGG